VTAYADVPYICFNLKRDASPVATLKARSEARNYDEFQSQARCQPRGDLVEEGESDLDTTKFQSQARCQPRGDTLQEAGVLMR